MNRRIYRAIDTYVLFLVGMTPQLKVLRLNRGQHCVEPKSLHSYNGTRFTIILHVLNAMLSQIGSVDLFLDYSWIEAIGDFVPFVGSFSPRLSCTIEI